MQPECGLVLKLSSAIASSIWLIGEKLINMCVSLVTMLIVARHLAPEAFGQLNYMVALVLLCAPLGALGLNSIVTRELVRRRVDSSAIIGTALVLRTLGACAVSVMMFLFSNYFVVAEFSRVFIYLLVANIFTAFFVFDFWLQANTANHYAAKARFCILIFASLLRVSAVWFDLKVTWFLLIAAIEIAAQGLALLWLYYYLRGGGLTYSKMESVSLLRQSWWLVLSAVAAAVYLRVDQVMLGKMVGAEEVGLYSLAARLSEVWYFFPTAVVISFFPRLLESRKQGSREYYTLLQNINDVLFGAALVLAILVTLVSGKLVPFLFGQDFYKSELILKLHIWAGLFIFMRALLDKWLIGEGMMKFALATQLSGAVINIALNFYLIPSYGAVGAAISTVISYAVASYFSLFFYKPAWPMARVMTMSIAFPVRLPAFSRKRFYNPPHS